MELRLHDHSNSIHLKSTLEDSRWCACPSWRGQGCTRESLQFVLIDISIPRRVYGVILFFSRDLYRIKDLNHVFAFFLFFLGDYPCGVEKLFVCWCVWLRKCVTWKKSYPCQPSLSDLLTSMSTSFQQWGNIFVEFFVPTVTMHVYLKLI